MRGLPGQARLGVDLLEKGERADSSAFFALWGRVGAVWGSLWSWSGPPLRVGTEQLLASGQVRVVKQPGADKGIMADSVCILRELEAGRS